MRFSKTHLLLVAMLVTGCETNDDDQAGQAADAAPAVEPDAEPLPVGTSRDLHTYGEFCQKDDDCQSGFCNQAACTVDCDAHVANDCREVDAFCVPTDSGRVGCVGHIETLGDSGDDAILREGARVTRKLIPVDDADLFFVTLPAGEFAITAEAAPDVDVQLEVYDMLTKNVATRNDGALGASETAMLSHTDWTGYYLVVRGVGGQASFFTLRVDRGE